MYRVITSSDITRQPPADLTHLQSTCRYEVTGSHMHQGITRENASLIRKPLIHHYDPVVPPCVHLHKYIVHPSHLGKTSRARAAR
jgi:hypothetical protein